MSFNMKAGILSVEFECDAKDNTSTLFVRAQCKKCGGEFEWSEKMRGQGYTTASIIQDLFLDATKKKCATCRLHDVEHTKEECRHAYVLQGECKRANRISDDYKKSAEALSKIGTIGAATESMRYIFKSINAMDSGKLYRCVRCDNRKEEYGNV